MAAERGGTARLDRRDYLQLAQAEMAGMGTPPCRSVITEDVADLYRRSALFGHAYLGLRLSGKDSSGLVTSVSVLVAT